jgi:3-hydroxyisobutyrate dehydrogenase-like beta-hydroxyacid dehydrogenase
VENDKCPNKNKGQPGTIKGTIAIMAGGEERDFDERYYILKTVGSREEKCLI